MPICIECRYPVKTLYTEYSGADDKSTGHGVRLTVCKNCGRFCDKYVEHDFVVLFIDLVLIKPQVYRHLLHNSFSEPSDALSRPIIRLGVLLILFDVYLTWARIERALPQPTLALSAANPDYVGIGANILAEQPIVTQYLFFLILCLLSTLAFHISIRTLTSSRLSPLRLLPLKESPFPYPRPNSVSTALLVSSSTKLFPILMVIWEYDVPAAARSLGWAVVANNIEALKILLDCGYPVACGLVAVGAAARLVVARSILYAVGLEGVDRGGNVFSHVKGSWTGGWGGAWELVREWGGRMGGL